jgi:hypothetical protein
MELNRLSRTEEPQSADPGETMDSFDQDRLVAMLAAAVAALFVLSGLPAAARWRRRFRFAAILVYAAAAALALLAIILWLIGGR